MPAPAAPADAIAIVSRTGPRAVVRYLVDHPDSYYGDIKDATGAAVSSLTRDLGLLEGIGVVTTDSTAPMGQRRGRSPRVSSRCRARGGATGRPTRPASRLN